jgi:hypothetical protein
MVKSHDAAEQSARTRLVKTLVDAAGRAIQQGHLADACDYVRALLVLDPAHKIAQQLLESVGKILAKKKKKRKR